MPTSATPVSRITVLADSDTRWKWGALTGRRIAADARLDARLLRGRATPTPRQLAELGIAADSLREITAEEFLREADRGTCDVVILACVGGTVQAMLHGLARAWRGLERRPVVVTGYVGVVYEKLADGLLLRHGADVVLANSRHDAQRFRHTYAGVGADPSSVVESALPFLDGAPYEPYDPACGRPFTVTFAAQPSVPDSRADRTYLLERAALHAERHSDRQVLVKLRSKLGEHTTHIEEFPYTRLARRRPGGLPPNLSLVYGHMGEVLDRTDLLVTVSSTAAIEAMHRSIPTAVLTDLGVREPLGNHHFLGSGCLASWDMLDEGTLPRADADWLRDHGVAVPDPFRATRERVTELASADRLPPLTPYYTPRTATGYLPGILGRHHLDAKGEPAGPGSGPHRVREPGRAERAARAALRDTARAAYRHGVQRIAPVIRRMGDL
ncbi:hypothetical protein NGB36_18465 [Streptomyces sp. RB6PN25]|uniref:Uncharacterized protein n=1 Tax=Streptomyces humicola TaxID=2953240 RepID=A0ABT1PXX0_9ACTN|nr:DUF6716 putative glycosyltransferase [Streptomyces humicola]MCQ4082530.1 hypothetical protein [Streptomyces humicola]